MNPTKTPHRMADITLSQAAIIAGISLLIMAILAPIANFSILQRVVVPDDAASTVSNILDSEGLFRIAICFFLIVAILDIIVAWALYAFLKPVNKSLSLLTAWFRLVYATMLGAVLIYLIKVLQLLNGAEYLSAFETSQLQAQVMLSLNNFALGWEFGLIIFGVHLLLLGYLFFRAGYMRKVLGMLLVLASLGYLIDGFGKLLSSNYNVSIAVYTFIGEVILIFWLFIKGRKLREQ